MQPVYSLLAARRQALASREADPLLIDALLHRYGPASLLELFAEACDRRQALTHAANLQSAPDWLAAAAGAAMLSARLGSRPFADVPYPPRPERPAPAVRLAPRPVITDDGRWLAAVNRDEAAYNVAAGRSGVLYSGD
jgi:hypothetical protein